jgi:hypothetical protein
LGLKRGLPEKIALELSQGDRTGRWILQRTVMRELNPRGAGGKT